MEQIDRRLNDESNIQVTFVLTYVQTIYQEVGAGGIRYVKCKKMLLVSSYRLQRVHRNDDSVGLNDDKLVSREPSI